MHREIIEPFRIKSVEALRFTTEEERGEILRRARHNPFLIDADDVLIDLLTDSGTSAMSANQWGAIMTGDESYAGSRSFRRFEAVVHDIFGFRHVIPTHQGRAAEKIVCTLLCGPGKAIPNNCHFDTTRANIEYKGAEAVDLVHDRARDPDDEHPFKGDVDLDRLAAFLKERGRDRVPFGMVTITNNAGGGQPVSMKNLRGVSRLLREHGVPFLIDACRFAENAWFIKTREPGYADRTPLEIAREMFSLADGATMSLKKDGFGNIGGFLALNDGALAERARNVLILTEGFPTYGGMAGRDMEALAVGMREALDERYLEYRVATVRFLAEHLTEQGIAVVRPPGGHAVYLDARRFYPQIPPLEYPAQALVCELYRKGGVRGVEIGSVMFGLHPDGTESPARQELVRLALPRRVYTQAHILYVAETLGEMYAERAGVRGLRIVRQSPYLRHFTAEFEPL
ncbi:MAG: tryptophanase [Fimbriimonadaceae bacterium]|nr:tryptophanase [Fimbriimonadaceae bacterium]